MHDLVSSRIAQALVKERQLLQQARLHNLRFFSCHFSQLRAQHCDSSAAHGLHDLQRALSDTVHLSRTIMPYHVT
jgi:hypothetical protein